MKQYHIEEEALKYFQAPANRPIFCISTGRSGTGLLAERMGRYFRVSSVHEPRPAFNEMRVVAPNSNGDWNIEGALKSWWLKKKLPAMYHTKKNGGAGKDRYVETSHVFCKGFFEPLIELGIVPDLIILRRDPRSVARSLWALGTIPLRNEKGIEWCQTPTDKVFFAPNVNLDRLSDYQLCFWYCLEIEARAKYYAEAVRLRDAKVCYLDFDALINDQWVSKVETAFGLKRTLRGLAQALIVKPPVKVNAKSAMKKRVLSNEQCTNEELHLLQLLMQR